MLKMKNCKKHLSVRKILKINKIAERYLSFMYYSDEAKGENLRVWEFISEPEISEFLKKCADEDKTNVS